MSNTDRNLVRSLFGDGSGEYEAMGEIVLKNMPKILRALTEKMQGVKKSSSPFLNISVFGQREKPYHSAELANY